MRLASNVYSIVVALVIACAPGLVKAANVEQGKHLAKMYCSRCHSIDKVGPSPLTIAPPFRTLHERFPVEELQEALAEGIVTGHPTMPQFQFEPDQINDFLVFLKTLE